MTWINREAERELREALAEGRMLWTPVCFDAIEKALRSMTVIDADDEAEESAHMNFLYDALNAWQTWAREFLIQPDELTHLGDHAAREQLGNVLRAARSTRTPKLRDCEKCGGPGPCLMDPASHRYACQSCHSEPDDPFFASYPRPEPAAKPKETQG